MYTRAGHLQAFRDRLPDPLRGAGDKRDPAIEGDLHVSISSLKVGRRIGALTLSPAVTDQFVAGLMFIASVSSSTRALMVILPFCIAHAEPTAVIGRR